MEDLDTWIDACLRAPLLDDESLPTLEHHVAVEPNDVRARVQLLVHYWRTGSHASRHVEHVVWLVDHRPELDLGPPATITHSEGYARARLAWLAAIDRDPHRWPILVNASNFFAVADTDLALDLLRRCVALHPEVMEWHERIAFLLMLGSDHSDEAAFVDRAREAANELVIAISLSLDAARRSQQEVELANVYFVAGDMERASTTARSLLEPHEGDDTRVAAERLHRGHIVLGHIALGAGDITEAMKHLRAATALPDRPRYKPDAKLARALIDAGEYDAVIEYIEATQKLGWSVVELSAWIALRGGVKLHVVS